MLCYGGHITNVVHSCLTSWVFEGVCVEYNFVVFRCTNTAVKCRCGIDQAKISIIRLNLDISNVIV